MLILSELLFAVTTVAIVAIKDRERMIQWEFQTPMTMKINKQSMKHCQFLSLLNL